MDTSVIDLGWWWLAIGLALLAVLLVKWRGAPHQSPEPLAQNDLFAATSAMSSVEMALLDYLVRAFPGRPVLFRMALSRLVTVRKTQSRLAAQQRLGTHVIDYTVCNRDGVPVFAFELDALHESTDIAERDALEKHRVLRTAGIRLVRLKRSTRDLPPPDEFRRMLRAAVLAPADSTEAAHSSAATRDRRRTKPSLSDRATDASAPAGFHDTVPLTVTGLMSLPPLADDDDDNDADNWPSTQRET